MNVGLPSLPQRDEQVHQRLGRFRVQVTGWFVSQDHGGVVRERSRHSHPLLFASAQFGGHVVRSGVQPHQLEKLVRPLLAAPPWASWRGSSGAPRSRARSGRDQVVELEDETDLLQPVVGQLVVVEGREVDVVYQNLAMRRPVESPHHVEQSGLPRPGRPDYSDDLPLPTVRSMPLSAGMLTRSFARYCTVTT